MADLDDLLGARGMYGLGGYSSLIERLNREGDFTGSPARLTYTSFVANASGPGPVTTPPPGRAVYIDTINIFSTTPIAVRFQIDNGSAWAGTGTKSPLDIGCGAGPGYSSIVPVKAFSRSGDRGGIGAIITQWLDPAVSGSHVVGIGANAWYLADSTNFDAKKVVLMLGDSTWNGTGPTTVDFAVPYQVNKFYRDQGQDTRYILKAYSGSNSVGHESYRAAGKYEFPQVDAIFYNLGINDAAQGVSTATRTANVQALIAWKQRRYPKAKLVIFGTTPVQTSAQETLIQAFRTADQATVAATSDPTVLFCNLGASFDRTVDTNYVSTDGAGGTRIHPTDPALTQLLAGGYNGNAGLRAWLIANMPVI